MEEIRLPSRWRYSAKPSQNLSVIHVVHCIRKMIVSAPPVFGSVSGLLMECGDPKNSFSETQHSKLSHLLRGEANSWFVHRSKSTGEIPRIQRNGSEKDKQGLMQRMPIAYWFLLFGLKESLIPLRHF